MPSSPANHNRGNRSLSSAKAARQDEFYTQLADIENELRHYKHHLRGKIVLCNCDDPYESNFFRYFASNFNALGLKRLICTSYAGSPIVGEQLPLLEIEGLKPNGKEPYLVEINEVPDLDNDGAISIEDVEQLLRHDSNVTRPLMQGGDFRSAECVEILKRADIVVTNPPFSLFREYLAQLVEHGKQFLIIGNVNAITYKEVFRLIMENRVWMGPSIHSGDREFRVPDHYPLQAAGFRVDAHGTKYIRVKGIRWFTNVDHEKRHETLPLFKKYSPEAYPIIDNYDVINVDKVVDIPADYNGRIGVPITFIDRYNPDQFEILAITKTWLGAATKTYPKQIQVNKDGRRSEVTKLNDGPAGKLSKPPVGETYYVVEGHCYTQLYQRLIIQRKQ